MTLKTPAFTTRAGVQWLGSLRHSVGESERIHSTVTSSAFSVVNASIIPASVSSDVTVSPEDGWGAGARKWGQADHTCGQHHLTDT